jgi:hypothetical protein
VKLVRLLLAGVERWKGQWGGGGVEMVKKSCSITCTNLSPVVDCQCRIRPQPEKEIPSIENGRMPGGRSRLVGIQQHPLRSPSHCRSPPPSHSHLTFFPSSIERPESSLLKYHAYVSLGQCAFRAIRTPSHRPPLSALNPSPSVSLLILHAPLLPRVLRVSNSLGGETWKGRGRKGVTASAPA